MALNFGKVNRSASFNPTSAFPLDARYYFETLAAAQAAAQTAVEVGSSEGTYFYGENLVVVENGKATLYLIQPDKTLTEIGAGSGSGGVTMDEVNDAIADAIAEASHTKREIVTELPAAADADPNTIYMVKVEGATGDSYKEYMLIGDAIEQIGDTTVDLSDYAKIEDLTTEKIDVAQGVYNDGDFTLDEVIDDISTRLDSLEEAKLTEEEENALADLVNGNVVKKIALGDESAYVATKDGVSVIPTATIARPGLVRDAVPETENSVAVDNMGFMSVNSLNVTKLVQTAGDVLILRGGSATS